MRSGRSIPESFMVLVPEAHPSPEASRAVGFTSGWWWGGGDAYDMRFAALKFIEITICVSRQSSSANAIFAHENAFVCG